MIQSTASWPALPAGEAAGYTDSCTTLQTGHGWRHFGRAGKGLQLEAALHLEGPPPLPLTHPGAPGPQGTWGAILMSQDAPPPQTHSRVSGQPQPMASRDPDGRGTLTGNSLLVADTLVEAAAQLLAAVPGDIVVTDVIQRDVTHCGVMHRTGWGSGPTWGSPWGLWLSFLSMTHWPHSVPANGSVLIAECELGPPLPHPHPQHTLRGDPGHHTGVSLPPSLSVQATFAGTEKAKR